MSSMFKFRLWVLAGSVLTVLLCQSFKDFSTPQPAKPARAKPLLTHHAMSNRAPTEVLMKR